LREIATKQLPNISPLVYDYFYAYEKVDDYYNGNFRDWDAIQRVAAEVSSRDLKREDITDVLEEQNTNFGCGTQTLDNIRKLRQADTCAVVTGQQVGLFSGPLYTIYKSLTAIKLAEYLSQKCAGNFVPVFWLASDDHDLAEIDHIKLLNKDNDIEKIHYQAPVSSGKIPATKIVFTPEISRSIDCLEDLTHDSEFKQEIISHLSQAYQPGRSFAEAFGVWMTQLFKSYGLVFIDATHPDFKELGKSVFHKEVTEESPSTVRAMETSNRLAQSGYNLQIQLHEGLLNLFFAEQERQAIQYKQGMYHIKGTQQAYAKNDLLDWADKKPQIFSPNVLLRPIYQDTLLPTAVYIGGPGEIAYFAQMKEIYKSFDIPMPIIYPRKMVTILEKKIDNVLKTYNLTIQDIWQYVESTINTMAKKQIPKSIVGALSATTSHLEQDFKALKREITAFEPTLENSVAITQGKINQNVRLLERKILQASKKHNSIVVQQLQKAKNSLHPSHRLQERVFNIAPFLIKYSFEFIDKLYHTIEIESHDHQIINL